MSLRSPVGRSYRTTAAAEVSHRPPLARDDHKDVDSRRHRPTNPRISNSNSSSTLMRLLLQAHSWMDDTIANVTTELRRSGTLRRETVLRVVALAITSLALLRLLVQLLLYSSALDSMYDDDDNNVKILIPTHYSYHWNFESTVFMDTTSTASPPSNTPPWSQTLPFLHRSIRPRHGTIDYQSLVMGVASYSLSSNTTTTTNAAAATAAATFAFDSGRRIRDHDWSLQHSEKEATLAAWDAPNDYHDAREKNLGDYVHYDETDYPVSHGCYRPKWSYAYQPTCNNFHDVSLARVPSRDALTVEAQYISHGFFRETFLVQRDDDYDAVLKVLRLHPKKNVNAFVMQQVQIEAVVMGETSGSGLTFDIYGHCGTSVTVERGYLIRNSVFTERLVDQKQLDREQVHGIKPRNRLTNEQRLRVALTMAESLAVLHGHVKGVIANDDVQIEQWLLDRNGHLKLNDFNNAVIVKWSPERNDYCMFRRSFNYIYRSPEENSYKWTDESSDVYALGMIYYTLMTGLVPFYQHEDWEKALEALRRGDKPYVDPRYTNHSFIESGLVKVMTPCWGLTSQERPSIFVIVKRLRKLVDIYERKNPGIKIREVDLTNLGYM